jgi:hypothetical protein
VNNVNLTNTSVTVTRVTNVYNTVIVNKTVNNFTYVNQHVNNGVTVVSHDAFVNARPVAQNVMRVDAKELAAAPVTHSIAAEPVRGSVLGSGRPVSFKPPAAVMTRPVVAVRTPPPPPRPLEQRQVQAGGHLNQQSLVRPMTGAQPASLNQGGGTPGTQQGFRSFTQPGSANPQVKTLPQAQPRVYEQQGSSQPENRKEPVNGNRATYPAPQPETHPLVRPAPPVQERNPQQEQQQAEKFNQWQQQRPAAPPPPAPKPASQPASHPAPPPPPAKQPSKK